MRGTACQVASTSDFLVELTVYRAEKTILLDQEPMYSEFCTHALADVQRGGLSLEELSGLALHRPKAAREALQESC